MDLKLYGLGFERDGSGKFRKLSRPVPGYRNQIQIAKDLYLKDSLPEGYVKTRLWIVCDSVFATVTTTAIRIDSVRVRVNARQMGVTSNNQLQDIADADPATQLFARWFETHYAELIPMHPELGAILESAKALAIARWMMSQKVGPDPRWAELLLPVADSTVVKGPALERRDTLQLPARRSLMFYSLTGGVELGGRIIAKKFIESNLDASSKGFRNGSVRNPSASKLFTAKESSIYTGKVAFEFLRENWIKNFRRQVGVGEEWEVGAHGLPVALVVRKGRRVSFRTEGLKLVAASTFDAKSQASIFRRPDGTSRLDYRDRSHLLVAEYDVHGTRTALWQYPSQRTTLRHR